jgi:hypothetical protein
MKKVSGAIFLQTSRSTLNHFDSDIFGSQTYYSVTRSVLNWTKVHCLWVNSFRIERHYVPFLVIQYAIMLMVINTFFNQCINCGKIFGSIAAKLY